MQVKKLTVSEMTGTQGVVDFGSLITMLSGGVAVSEGRPSLVASAMMKLIKNRQISY